jgi:hypothetical protein
MWSCSAVSAIVSFRYVVLYNDDTTDATDPLIAYWDYGSETMLSPGEKFTIDFGVNILTWA